MKKHFLLALLALFPLLGWAAVDPISLENFNLVVEQRDYVYTGKPQVPVVHQLQDPNAVTVNDQYFALRFYATPQSTEEEALDPETIINAGTYYVAAYGITELYVGETPRVQFNIIRKNLADEDVVVTGVSDQNYTGGAITFDELTVTFNGMTLTKDEDYTVSYDSNIEVGTNTAKVIFTAPETEGNYFGKKEVTFSILKKSISIDNEDVTVTVTTNPNYKNDFVVPTLEVKYVVGDNTIVLEEGTDYELVNETYKDAGAAVVTIKGIGNYTDERTQDFTIKPRRIDYGTITLEYTKELTYNGEPQGPLEFKVTDTAIKDKPVLTKGKDYYVEYLLANQEWGTEPDSKDVGTYNIRIKGRGNYDHTKPNSTQNPRTYDIIAKPIKITANDLTVGYGTAIKPTATFSEEVTDETIAVTFKYGETEEGATATAPTAVGTYNIYPVATSTNYALELVPGKLTITMATLHLIVNADAINYGQTPSFSLSEEDGLVGNFNARNLSETPQYLIDGKPLSECLDDYGFLSVKREKVEEGEGAILPYKVTVAQTNLVYAGNYNVIVKAADLTVNPLDLQDAILTYSTQPLTYNGENQTPDITLNYILFNPYRNITLKKDADYKVESEGNVDVTNNARFTVNGINNFTGQGTGTFRITRAPLTIKADDRTVAYDELAAGTTFTYTVVDPELLTPTELPGKDKGNETDVTGMLTNDGKVVVTNTSTNSRGIHENALVASITPRNSNFQNYTVTFVPGDLTVTPAEAFVQAVVDTEVANTIVYGDELALGWKYVSGLVADEAAYWESLITGDAEFTIVDGEGNEVTANPIPVGEYTIKVSGLSATDYDVKDNELGMLIVIPKEITVKAKEQIIPYGDEPSTAVSEETVEVEGLVGNDKLEDLGITIKIEEGETLTSVGTHENAIQIVKGENPNYEFTPVPANLIVEGNLEDGVLALDRVAPAIYTNEEWNAEYNTAASLVRDYHGQKVNVGFKATGVVDGEPTDQAFNMIGNKWYSLVLPFETSARDLAKVMDVAAVNILDVENTAKDKIVFKLEVGIIPANTPFIFKLYGEFTGENPVDMTEALFKDKTIEYVADEPVVSDQSNVKFIGTYTGKRGFKANEYFFTTNPAEDTWNHYYYGSDTNTTFQRPLSAYMVVGGEEPAGARTFVFEEADGTLTTIRPVGTNNTVYSVEGWYTLDGMKLNAAPTEKGIYINNGKKVVIK